MANKSFESGPAWLSRGLKIISNSSSNRDKTIEFVILDKEKAIETLINYIDSGYVLTLNDDRDKREGAISIKKDKGVYLKSGGGHGFSVDWEAVTINDVSWLIKVTAPFNNGNSKGSYGVIKQNS